MLINPHAVIGYPVGPAGDTGSAATHLSKGWKIGTALDSGTDGTYRAETYDRCRLAHPAGPAHRRADTVTGVPVEIYAYSKTDKIGAGSC